MNNICGNCKHQGYCDTRYEIDKFIDDMKTNYYLDVEVKATKNCEEKEE